MFCTLLGIFYAKNTTKIDIFNRMPGLIRSLGTTSEQTFAIIWHLEFAEFHEKLKVKSLLIVFRCSNVDVRQNSELCHILENQSI